MTLVAYRLFGRSALLALLVLCIGLLESGCGNKDTASKTAAASANDAPPSAGSIQKQATPSAALLEYVERLTPGAVANEPLPMVIGIHGLGDQPENYGALYDGLPFKARVILPRAPKSHYGGFSWFDIDLPFNGKQEGLAKGIAQAAAQVASLIDVLVEKRPTIGKPIVTGFSQGGMISFALAVNHPEKAGLVIPISGALPDELIPKENAGANKPPIRAFTGKADDIVPFVDVLKTVRRLELKEHDVQLKAYPDIPHAIPLEIQRDVFATLFQVVKTADDKSP